MNIEELNKAGNKMSRTKDMTKGSPFKLILGFVIPLVIANMGQQLYMIVDASIVGRGVGVDALAAVGSADWIYWLILWSLIQLTQGFATFVSRYFGEKNYRDMNKTIAMSTILTVVIGAVLTGIGLVAERPTLEMLDTPKNIIDGAEVYLITMIAGTIAVSAYNMAAAILRALGDGKSPLIAMLIAAILNIALDLLFVINFDLGIFGAALASVLAQVVSFCYCLIQIGRTDCVKLSAPAWKIDFRLCGKLLKFGIPLALQYAVIALGGIILQSTINKQGSAFVAGYTSVNKLYGFLECTAISLGAAFTTFFAQNFGAGQKKRVKEGIRTGIKLCIVSSVVIAAIVLVFGKSMLQLFLDISQKDGLEALGVGWHYLWIMALWMPVLYIIYVYRSILQAAEISFWSMISGVAEFGVRVIMGKVIICLAGIDTLFYVEPVAWLAALLFVMVPYYIKRESLYEKL